LPSLDEVGHLRSTQVTRTAQALGFAGWPTGQVDVAAVHVLAEAIATKLAIIHPDRIEHTEAKWPGSASGTGRYVTDERDPPLPPARR
jgi:hypothetical protein